MDYSYDFQSNGSCINYPHQNISKANNLTKVILHFKSSILYKKRVLI